MLLCNEAATNLYCFVSITIIDDLAQSAYGTKSPDGRDINPVDN